MDSILVTLNDADESTVVEWIDEDLTVEQINKHLDKIYGKNGWYAYNRD